jgi:hypothetical protein
MTRFATAALAVAALLVAGCGGGSDQPVEGSTTPAAVSTSATTTTPATTTPKVDLKAQLAKLRVCIGGKPGETYEWFQPTVDYATTLGGGGFTVTLKKLPLTLIVFPSPAAAQLGYQDISDRLIALQQKRPTDYATVSATAAQALGSVLEVATAGATSPEVNAKVTGCVSSSAT